MIYGMARGIDFQYIEYIVNQYYNGFLSVEMRRLQKTMVKPNKPQNPQNPKNGPKPPNNS